MGPVEDAPGNQPLGPLRGPQRLVAADAQKEPDELVAAQAGDGVVTPLHPAQDAAELPDHAVSHLRPVRLVDAPEVVDIRYDAGEGPPDAARRLGAPVEIERETAPVGQPGQSVPHGEVRKLPAGEDGFPVHLPVREERLRTVEDLLFRKVRGEDHVRPRLPEPAGPPDGALSADQEHGNPGSAAVPEPPQDLLFLGDVSVLPQQDRREPRPPSRFREERAPGTGRLHRVTAAGQQVPDAPEDGP